MTVQATFVYSDRDRIEQAVARGESVDWMVANLGVDLATVINVMSDMDAAIRETDQTCPGAGRRKRDTP